MNFKRLLKRLGAGKLIILIRKIEPYIFSIPAVFIYIGLYLVKTIKGKRIVFVEIDCYRIGHLAANTELFLRRLKYGNYYNKDNVYIGFCRYFPICNHQLFNMFRRHFFIIESRILGKLFNTWIQRTEFYHAPPFNSNEYYEFNNFKQILSFTEEEENKGKQLLAEMGIEKNAWFVCFHSRDSKYLGQGSEHHNYRDSDVNNYLKAAEYITEQGGYAIRMGAIVEKPLPKERHTHIIDYAMDYRSEFMDIYLSAKCKFFVGTSAGLFLVPTAFGVPVAGTNFVHFELPPLGKNDIFIPKKVRNIKENRFLTFSELFDRRIGSWLDSNDFTRTGLEVVENTPDEILGLVQEMNEFLDGRFQYTKEDQKLQSCYRAFIKPHHFNYKVFTKVGTLFLKGNKELLK
jgi:putative glycosyltransferase (TIGR04372 family)